MPLSSHEAQCLRHVYVVMQQAERARGRGRGRGRGRRRRFHEDEEEGGMTLEEWEAQQGGHHMFCLALVRRCASRKAVLKEKVCLKAMRLRHGLLRLNQ